MTAFSHYSMGMGVGKLDPRPAAGCGNRLHRTPAKSEILRGLFPAPFSPELSHKG